MNTKIKKNIINIFGDVISTTQDCGQISLEQIEFLINSRIIVPIDRLSILNQDETISYVIPEKDIYNQGISYQENYQNGQRRSLSVKLINNPKSVLKQNLNKSSQKYVDQNFDYFPNVNGIWYGTKFKYDIGFEYNGESFFFDRGIYVVTNFNLEYGISNNYVEFSLGDKFCLFENNTGTLIEGYEIPPEIIVCEVIKAIQNLTCTDGVVMDIKTPIIHNSYANFETQQTIAVSAGGRIADLYEGIGTQMSAEYYYNNQGNLCFQPMDESMNEINKPVIWSYVFDELDGFNLTVAQNVVNVVKVIGTNVNEESVYSGIAKNTNLNSSINIYYVKERSEAPIENSNIFSNVQAEELSSYYLRQKTIQQFDQQIEVPFNPLLSVNNIIEVTIKKMKIERKRFLINSISYNSRSLTMNIGIVNIDELPIIGGI